MAVGWAKNQMQKKWLTMMKAADTAATAANDGMGYVGTTSIVFVSGRMMVGVGPVVAGWSMMTGLLSLEKYAKSDPDIDLGHPYLSNELNLLVSDSSQVES
ncbi:hypothetical protein L208DRAFT_743082 [Tricholoma matsutake]|nr:hypothetical protein L208DRAFT_743082 [Tricholoma matsutake 945]